MSIFDRYSRVWADGKRGFGKESYNAAKAAGISDRELQSGLQGLRIGKIAQQSLDAGMKSSPLFSRFATIWGDNQLGFGQEAYTAARLQGLSNTDLKQGLSGFRIGRAATARIEEGTKIEGQKAEAEAQIADMMSQARAATPDPRALTKSASAVGGSARGVKINRSKKAKSRSSSGGTSQLNRRARNSQLQINNLNT